MENGLLRIFHAGLADPIRARQRQVALAARCADRKSMGYGEADEVSMQWSEMEVTLEADVALIRSQLNALPIWDPDLQMRLRRWSNADGAQTLAPGPWRREVAPEGGALECSSLVQGESLAMLSGEATSRTQSSACVWVYRFSHPAEAAAQLSYHPSLAATATALRAAVLCRIPNVDPVVGMQVYLVIVWRGQATVPTGSPLPLAAPARGERLLRQRVLEVLAAEAYGDATLASSLREELQELASDHFGVDAALECSAVGPRFTCRLVDLARLDEEESRVRSTTCQSVFVGLKDRSMRRKKPAVLAASEKSLLESDLSAALAAARRLLKQDLSEVLNPSPSSRAVPFSGNLDQLEVQKGLLHLASGIRAQALVHSGDKVPVCLAVKPDYTMSVQVSDETRTYSLTDIDQVASGEKALALLHGCLSCKPPSRICALKMKDGNCLALLPSELVPDLFVRCLLHLRQCAEDVEKHGMSQGPVKRASALSGGKIPAAEAQGPSTNIMQEPAPAEPVTTELSSSTARDAKTEPDARGRLSSRMGTQSCSGTTTPRGSRYLNASIDDAASLPRTVVATQGQSAVVAGNTWGVWQAPHLLPAWPMTSQWQPVVSLPARSVSPPCARSLVTPTQVPMCQSSLATQAVPQWTRTVVHAPYPQTVTGWVATAQRSLPARPIAMHEVVSLGRLAAASTDGHTVRQMLPATIT